MAICNQCNTGFEVSPKEKEFCARIGVPEPVACRECRVRALMATRNEWKLYRRKCDFTGDEIISAYPPDSPFKVYKNSVWWGDEWDAISYGRDFDFSQPFFAQFAKLQKAVPREGTSVFSSENCEFNSHIRESKNCYLNSLVYQCEDLYYSYWMVHDKDVFDSMYTNESTLCFNCTSVNNGYGCVMTDESENCSDCAFCYQCRGCDHCLYCSNLANKSYHLFNKSCTKEEFEETKKKSLNGSWSRWNEAYGHYLDMRKKAVQRYVHNLNCENVTGDHLYNCRNCEDCYESFDSEEGVACVSLDHSKIVQNIYSAGWPGCEGVYQSSVIRGSKDIAFCTYTWFSGTLRYCDSCNACTDCFGCIGLQHKEHCILNKQYTKAEYEKIIAKIIAHMKKTRLPDGQAGEWGQFFPSALSPYAYNESAATDFFPLEEKQAVKMGWRWRSKDKREYMPATLKAIPDNIADVTDDIIKEVLACERCGKNYKIIPQELKFYRQTNLPIPRHCPDCRFRIRFDLRNPLRLFKRKCDKCQAEIQSSYAPGRPEKVYCEKCYLQAIY